MSERVFLTAGQVLERLKIIAASALISERIDTWREGAKKVESHHVWLRVDRARFRLVFKELVEIDYPHLAVISGNDIGTAVELLYHFFIYYGYHQKQLMVTLAVPLPKDDPSLPTITDIIPGALTSEREKQEMLGVKIIDIPDSRRMFLDDDFPAGVYPWRKDETGLPETMIKQLWDTGRTGCELDHVQTEEQKAAAAEAAAAAKAAKAAKAAAAAAEKAAIANAATVATEQPAAPASASAPETPAAPEPAPGAAPTGEAGGQ